MKPAVLVLALAGCGRAPGASCEQDLAGTYVTANGRRWMILDRGATLEAYPLFPDVPAAGALEVAPRVIDLDRRDGGAIEGLVRRRYLRGSAICTATAPARAVACRGEQLELELADPVPPLDFGPCRAGPAGPVRRERWTRE